MTDMNITAADVLALARHTEIGNHDPYALSHAGTSKSGYSIGVMQTDLSVHMQVREDVANSTYKIGSEENKSLKSALATKGDPNALNTAQRYDANAMFKTPAGHKIANAGDLAAANEAVRKASTVPGDADRFHPDQVAAGQMKTPTL